MATAEDYLNVQKEYRKKFLRLQQQIENEYDDINRKLLDKINKLAVDYAIADGTFNRAKIRQIKREIDSITAWFQSETKDWLDTNITKSAQIAINGQDKAAEYYITGLIETVAIAERKLLQRALTADDGILLRTRYGGGLAKEIRNQVWAYRWSDGYTLSDRIWKLHDLANSNLKSMIQQSVNNGLSAVDFSKQVEKYLQVSGPSWTTAIKPSKTGRGSIKYNSLRLARSETQNAYRRGQKISAQKSEIVKGIRWNLSSSHPSYPPSYEYEGYQEICDWLAGNNHDELGAGVFKPDNIPITPHPQCLCYWTDEVLQGDELINVLKKKYGGD
ncbi:hypothetical protein [Halocella sp. SP3-1]|uniref:hypothetical protein n=1 Tax=Halocella sp. SP3-1 TaxID=2382161 RepID=UPI000F74D5BE|nr:hypothetical protein [Halocella sp. SP3-1]AZO96142.1 hypothetical protein D7D81_16950 [Halocella sp. SP3-1]